MSEGVPASGSSEWDVDLGDSSWRPSAWWGLLLMLGLVQRWGEVFPRWMIGLAGRRVPMALAVVPASLASVLLVVGGIGIWSGLGQMVVNVEAAGAKGYGNLAGKYSSRWVPPCCFRCGV